MEESAYPYVLDKAEFHGFAKWPHLIGFGAIIPSWVYFRA